MKKPQDIKASASMPLLSKKLSVSNLQRKVRELKKHLKEHTEITKKVITAMDAEMKKPSDVERGRRIAKIISALEFGNDSARHFGLDEKFPLSR